LIRHSSTSSSWPSSNALLTIAVESDAKHLNRSTKRKRVSAPGIASSLAGAMKGKATEICRQSEPGLEESPMRRCESRET